MAAREQTGRKQRKAGAARWIFGGDRIRPGPLGPHPYNGCAPTRRTLMRPPCLDELPWVAHLRTPGGNPTNPGRHSRADGRPAAGHRRDGGDRIRTCIVPGPRPGAMARLGDAPEWESRAFHRQYLPGPICSKVIKSWQMGRGLDTRTVSCYTGALRHHLLAL